MEPTLMKMALWSKSATQPLKHIASNTRDRLWKLVPTPNPQSLQETVHSPPKSHIQGGFGNVPSPGSAHFETLTSAQKASPGTFQTNKDPFNLNNNPLDIIMAKQGMEKQHHTLVRPADLGQTICKAFTTSTMNRSRNSRQKTKKEAGRSVDLNLSTDNSEGVVQQKGARKSRSFNAGKLPISSPDFRLRRQKSSPQEKRRKQITVKRSQKSKRSATKLNFKLTPHLMSPRLLLKENALLKERLLALHVENVYRELAQESQNRLDVLQNPCASSGIQIVSCKSDNENKTHSTSGPSANPARVSSDLSVTQPSIGVSPLPQPSELPSAPDVPCPEGMVPSIKEKLWGKWRSLRNPDLCSLAYLIKLYMRALLYESSISNTR